MPFTWAPTKEKTVLKPSTPAGLACFYSSCLETWLLHYAAALLYSLQNPTAVLETLRLTRSWRRLGFLLRVRCYLPSSCDGTPYRTAHRSGVVIFTALLGWGQWPGSSAGGSTLLSYIWTAAARLAATRPLQKPPRAGALDFATISSRLGHCGLPKYVPWTRHTDDAGPSHICHGYWLEALIMC